MTDDVDTQTSSESMCMVKIYGESYKVKEDYVVYLFLFPKYTF